MRYGDCKWFEKLIIAGFVFFQLEFNVIVRNAAFVKFCTAGSHSIAPLKAVQNYKVIKIPMYDTRRLE